MFMKTGQTELHYKNLRDEQIWEDCIMQTYEDFII